MELITRSIHHHRLSKICAKPTSHMILKGIYPPVVDAITWGHRIQVAMHNVSKPYFLVLICALSIAVHSQPKKRDYRPLFQRMHNTLRRSIRSCTLEGFGPAFDYRTLVSRICIWSRLSRVSASMHIEESLNQPCVVFHLALGWQTGSGGTELGRQVLGPPG